MGGYKVAGGHRKRTMKPSMGDAKRARDAKRREAQDVDACRFPRPCRCTQCEPEGT